MKKTDKDISFLKSEITAFIEALNGFIASLGVSKKKPKKCTPVQELLPGILSDTQDKKNALLELIEQNPNKLIAIDSAGNKTFLNGGYALPAGYRLRKVTSEYPEQVRVVCHHNDSYGNHRHVLNVPWWWAGYTLTDIERAAQLIETRCKTYAAFDVTLTDYKGDCDTYLLMGPFHKDKDIDVYRHIVFSCGDASRKKSLDGWVATLKKTKANAVKTSDIQQQAIGTVGLMQVSGHSTITETVDTIKSTLPPQWTMTKVTTRDLKVYDMRHFQEIAGGIGKVKGIVPISVSISTSVLFLNLKNSSRLGKVSVKGDMS